MEKMFSLEENTIVNEKASSSLPHILLTFFIVCGMVIASEVLHEKEILFPEIAAIAVGSLIAPKFAWNTSKLRMIVGIMICAILGVGIVCYLSAPLFVQITVAYFVGRLVLMFMQVTFAPMISAIVLPVLLQTDSPVYLIAAFLLTTCIVCIRIFFEKRNLVEYRNYTKKELAVKEEFIKIGICTAFVLFLSWLCIFLDFRFVIAPPLLVAFTEFTNPSSKARKNPTLTVLVIAGCALAGATCRYFFTMTLGLPLALATFIGLILVLIMLQTSQLHLPPAGALMVLAMLIPESIVVTFPVQVLIGCSIMMLFNLLIFKES